MSPTPSKSRARYRLTRHSAIWILAALLLIPYEILMVLRGQEGGPLTHVVRWAYGEPWSIRWWLLGWANTGFLLWMPPHFLFEEVGFFALLAFVGAGLLIGAAGLYFTR